MQFTSSLRRQARSLVAALLLVFCAAEAYGADSYSTSAFTLTIPSLVIGSATYSTVNITGLNISDIVAIENNGTPGGNEDTYVPANETLFIPDVTVNSGTNPYTNVTVSTAQLTALQGDRISFGSVNGADTYGFNSAYSSHSAVLSIPMVQITAGALAGQTFCNVVVTPDVTPGAYHVSMGMPQLAGDEYNPGTGVLTIPAVTLLANNAVYTNVTVTITLADVLAYSSCGSGTAGRFAYVSNDGDGTISAYSINRQTGALTPLTVGTIPIPSSSALWEIKVDPSGKYLYVLDYGSAGIYGFSINQGDGSLTALNGGSAFATGNYPQSLAFDATGAYLYVATGDNTIWAYSLNPSTGALGALSSSPYTISGVNPNPQQIVRAGNYLYTADGGANSVDVFAITPGTGALQEGATGSPYPTDIGPYSLTSDPSGAVLYTANAAASGNGSISAFTINPSTGVLAPVAGNPLPILVANEVTIDPQGKFLFVTETSGVAVYPINKSTGVLGALVAGLPFAAGSNPYIAVADPTDSFVYVGNDQSANVSEFTFNALTGFLAPVTGSPMAAGLYPDFIAIR